MRRLVAGTLLGLCLVGPWTAPARAVEPRVERLDLRDARVGDAVRLIAEVGGGNVVVSSAGAERRVSLLLQGLPLRAALETLCKLAGLWFREEAGVLRILTAEEFQAELVIRREARVRTFTLLQPNAREVAWAIRDLYGERVVLSDRAAFDGEDARRLGGGPAGAAPPAANAGPLAGVGGLASSQPVGPRGGLPAGAGVPLASPGGNAVAASERLAERVVREPLSAARLARVQVEDGRVAGDVAGLSEGLPPIYVSVGRRHNLIAVRSGDDAALDQIAGLVAELDRPTPQVLLEVKILEVRLGDGFHSLVDVGLSRPGETPRDLSGDLAGVVETVAAGGPGGLVYRFLDEHVRVRLELLEREERVSTLATPLLLCANQETARVFVGEERPLVRDFALQTFTTEGILQTQLAPTVELRDVGNQLRIVPRINADRTVSLSLLQDVSSVVAGGASLPVPDGRGGVTAFPVDTVSTANLEGTVIAKDGLTLVVGGLIRRELGDRRAGLPYLMDLPLLGWLFGETERVAEERELILLITPHVLMTPAEGQARSRARLRALSRHPYRELGDEALSLYEPEEVPGAVDYRALVEDYLEPAPEPSK